MAGGHWPEPGRQAPPGARAAVRRPTDAVKPHAPAWVLAVSSPIPPVLRAVFEHALFAGPILGVLSALYGYHLSQTSPSAPDLATYAVIRQAQIWHGHFLRNYYITPEQNTLWWALSAPAIAWLVLLVVGIMALGMRSHYLKQPNGGRRRH